MYLTAVQREPNKNNIRTGLTSRQTSNSVHISDFYIHCSMHRNSILIRSNKTQQYAGIYLLQNHCTCFRCPLHPSSVRKTVTAASGTGHST